MCAVELHSSEPVPHTGIVEADELAGQYVEAGCDSYGTSVGKVLDGLAAELDALYRLPSAV